ncbi:hypothetical protein [Allokutzneria sp. NRRL B-24872]|uniref:hypothetical protein n=1 Tax=Allokutzneria sp. NRRL B-24872 TaxID=1137961 RepID=UPI000A36FA4D|nr:hypothetical protein [Allokutzneria sp. NRRL B-24872]
MSVLVGGFVGVGSATAVGAQRSVLDCGGNPKSPNGAAGSCTGVPRTWQYRIYVRCGNENYKNAGAWKNNREYSTAWCNWDDERRTWGFEERYIG